MSKISKISSFKTVSTFLMSNKACSGTLFNVINGANGNRMEKEEYSAMPFAGGIMQNGYQCGQIWGATLAAGAEAYKQFGGNTKAECKAILSAKRLVNSFNTLNKNINCYEITELDKTSSNKELLKYFLLKGGTVACCKRAAKFAKVAYKDINIVFSKEFNQIPPAPVSCASLLAKKKCLSDLHSTMLSGFAGGIGLCGGACGALGAALWIFNYNCLKNGEKKLQFKNPKALDIIDKFLKATNYEFECCKIVGKKFDSINEYSTFLEKGGCKELIDLLAKELN